VDGTTVPLGTGVYVSGTVQIPGQSPDEATVLELIGLLDGAEEPFGSTSVTAKGGEPWTFVIVEPAYVVLGTNVISVRNADDPESGLPQCDVTVHVEDAGPRLAIFSPTTKVLSLRPLASGNPSNVELPVGERVHSMVGSNASSRVFLSEPAAGLIHVVDVLDSTLLPPVSVGTGMLPGCMALSADGGLLAVALAGDNSIRLYDVASGSLHYVNGEPCVYPTGGTVVGAALDPGPTNVIWADFGGGIHIRPVVGGEGIDLAGGGIPSPLASMSVSADGRRATLLGHSSSRDVVSIDLWETSPIELARSPELFGAPGALGAAGGDRYPVAFDVAGVNNGVALLDATSLSIVGVLLHHHGQVSAVAAGSSHLFVASAESGKVFVYNTDGGRRVPVLVEAWPAAGSALLAIVE
jgi:WD40 repeat protein